MGAGYVHIAVPGSLYGGGLCTHSSPWVFVWGRAVYKQQSLGLCMRAGCVHIAIPGSFMGAGCVHIAVPGSLYEGGLRTR